MPQPVNALLEERRPAHILCVMSRTVCRTFLAAGLAAAILSGQSWLGGPLLPSARTRAPGFPLHAQGTPTRFSAGAAISNITPPLGEPIVGNWTPVPAAHVHDELYARCLVLDDGQARMAIVVADNLGIPRHVADQAKRLAREQSGIPPERILIASTHTHSATTARGSERDDPREPLDAYQTFLVGRIADGIRRAANNLEPARIAVGRGRLAEQVFNRR